jgi:hypothetical protein
MARSAAAILSYKGGGAIDSGPWRPDQGIKIAQKFTFCLFTIRHDQIFLVLAL